MNNLWWLALPVLAAPIWWHRQKRERLQAEPLATARFLPRAVPQQLRVWHWKDRLLLLVRCLLLAALIALLADPVLAWRGDSVLVVHGADANWLERQVSEAGFKGARRIDLPTGDALGWLAAHEREWQAGARLLVAGNVAMPAAQPVLRHRVELRSAAPPVSKFEHHIAVVSKRAARWRTLFASLGAGYVVTDAPEANSELVVWDLPDAPPPNLRAPLWWIGDASAFPELRNSPMVDGIHYAASAHGRLWSSSAWPPADADAARALFESWQRLHYAPVAYQPPSQVIAANPAALTAPVAPGTNALRDWLLIALAALFALERMMAHASRR
jgi:hypothetical protein